MNFTYRNFLHSTLFLILALTSCEKKSVIPPSPKTITMSPAEVRLDGKMMGRGTVVKNSDSREFLVTARRLFRKEGHYDVTFISKDVETIQDIIKVDSNTTNEVCVCELGSDAKLILPIQRLSATATDLFSRVSQNRPIKQLVYANQIRLRNALNGIQFRSLSVWEGFPQPVECIKGLSGPDAFGLGLSSGDSNFWVVFSHCPEPHAELLRAAFGYRQTDDFTVICGTSFAEIFTQHSKMQGT
jgi:hypothetical protein